jgi:glycine/D-amino acid oxidase-like deaminating enzyme
MSLSWGTAQQALELVGRAKRDAVGVIGCGVVGLTTARVFQEAGYAVTIYAKEFSPYTTSDASGALWTPFSVYDRTAAAPSFEMKFVDACERSEFYLRTLVGAKYGVRWIENYDCYDRSESGFLRKYAMPVIRHLYRDVHDLAPGKHPFSKKQFATRFRALFMEPGQYLQALRYDLEAHGGMIVKQTFRNRDDLETIPQPLVVNCTGPGARELFGDMTLIPVRGQLSLLGTYDEGEWRPEPDREKGREIVEDHRAFFEVMTA